MRVDLPVISYQYPRSGRGSEYKIYLLSDVHAGSRHVQTGELDAVIADIRRDSSARWVGLGDFGDWISFSDNRFVHYEYADWMDVVDPWMSTIDYLGDKFKPISGQCLGMIEGNHEITARQRYHMPVHKHLCARLGVIDLGTMCYMRLRFQRSRQSSRANCIMQLQHGFGGGRTAGSRAGKLEQQMRDYQADVYAFGHVHGQQVAVKSQRVELARDIDEAQAVVRYGVSCGTWLTMSEYERRNGYGASTVGPALVYVRPFAARESDRLEVRM